MDKATYLARQRDMLTGRQFATVGRGIVKGRLLDDGDQNIGNGTPVQAYPDPAQAVATILPQTNPPRILALDAISPSGQVVCIGVTASGIPDFINNATFPTPITGIVEIGNGSVFTRIEFDVPVGRYALQSTLGDAPATPDDGVVLITVPAGTLRVYARNDSKLIVTDMIGLVGDANMATLLPPVEGLAADAFVKAFATYNMIRSHAISPTRTYYIGKANGGPLTFVSSITTAYAIPPLATRFKVMRLVGAPSTMPAVTGDIFNAAIERIESFSIALNAPSPWIDLPGTATFVGIDLVLPDGGRAALVFEIGI
jgi:hypothetical protein